MKQGHRRWLLRGLARSHRSCTGLGNCAVPVGAGKPAKQPTPAQRSISPKAAGRPACPCGKPSA
ncbi:hypothetical protein FYM84_19205 [Pseudomonas sp. CAH-1]|nr:hypothetical protein [Pseudomonas sp. CAH-1]